jgi:hypothetical protein
MHCSTPLAKRHGIGTLRGSLRDFSLILIFVIPKIEMMAILRISQEMEVLKLIQVLAK